MPRGGARSGSGRPRGATTIARKDVLRRIEKLGVTDFVQALSAVADDESAPTSTRQEAIFLLSGAMAGRLAVNTKRRVTAAVSKSAAPAPEPESQPVPMPDRVEPSDIVTISNGEPMATSLTVAEKFGKQHKHVLDAIRNLECSEEFTRSNFRPCEYRNQKGVEQPYYLMTRDGFTFLAMGFTGKGAARWKEAYIKAFNAMEAELVKATPQAASKGLALEYVKLARELLPNLSTEACQVMISRASANDLGYELLPPPEVKERLYSATELAQENGCHRSRIGRVANVCDFKVDPEYGKWVLGTKEHSEGQVSTFLYNERGRRAIALALSSTQPAVPSRKG